MLELIILAVLAFATYHFSFLKDEVVDAPLDSNDRFGKLWDLAHASIRDSRFLRAEKALLTILKMDEKNAAAYNRLGILYAKQKEYRDAIDCFEIASSIEPTASSLHNLGLIYYETENFERAAVAFEQALKLEGDLAARHVAYAKVVEKLGNDKLMFQELKRAAELEPNRETYNLLLKAYDSRGMAKEADIIRDRLAKLITTSTGKRRRITRPKRVVV